MPEMHLMCGFIGFGKTTLAKKLEKQLPAIRFTHDELMQKTYGRCPDNFDEKYKIIDNFIWKEAEKAIKAGKNVILDYGFWNKEARARAMERATRFIPAQNIIWHFVECPLDVAKQRTLERTSTNTKELFIDEKCFDSLVVKWQPISDDEKLNVIKHIDCNPSKG